MIAISWSSITGRECHDAGGRDGIGNLFISLETALMVNSSVRLPPEGVDFIVIAVPADKRDLIEQDFEARWGTNINQN